MNPGTLRDRFALDRPVTTADDFGGQGPGWTEMAIVWGGIRYLRGGDVVQSARLSGRQPAVITLRASSLTRQIDHTWRLRNVRDGAVYDVRGTVETANRSFIEITAESGMREN